MKNSQTITIDYALASKKKQPTSKFNQFPLVFMNPPVDIITKTLTSFGTQQAYRVVYMGPRHNSNLKAYKNYCYNQRNPNAQESQAQGTKQINKFNFSQANEIENYFPIRMSEYRLFTGMNPTFTQDDLKFQSDFQCGNLDLAIYVSPQQYDLFMRVDSNTKGHTCWFYFKVSNVGKNQKIKFNIVNFNKKQSSYRDGMKPYVYKKSTGQWSQAGISVSYCPKKLRYQQNDVYDYKCLSFTYQFKDSEQVSFAYCVPYSYSYLLSRLQQFSNKSSNFIKIEYSQSSGGLPVPILTITNFNNLENKANILCLGRLHPGETQGSWMMDGFINYLLSAEASYLRDTLCFKIVPMVNVDGVVLGNFRTGIMGRDLNRSFNFEDAYNQINILKKIALQTKPTIFLDFHGHSSKKNVFIYGPDYKIEDKNYIMCRLYPKLISKQTQAFRYYSCSFNISKNKISTARAAMMKQFKVQFSYTIQASTYSYGPTKTQTCFNSNEYTKVGGRIAHSLNDFVKIINTLSKSQEIRQKSSKQINDLKPMQSLASNHKSLINQLLKDASQLQKQQRQSSQESDCQDQTNDYTNSDLKDIMGSKFEAKAKGKQKKNKKSKTNKDVEKPKTRKQTSLELSKNSLQPNSKKTLFDRKKSFLRKRQDEQLANLISTQSIIEISHLNNFKTKASKIIESHSSIVNRILRKKERIMFFNQQFQASSILQRKNKVHYNWSGQKKLNEESSKHFHFDLPENDEAVIRSLRKQGFRAVEVQQKNGKRKTPIEPIKKTLLPSLGHSTQLSRQSLQREVEKSALGEILEEYEKKKKQRKDFKIFFL